MSDGNTTTAIRAGYLIGFQDGEHRLIRDGALLYKGDAIEYVGPWRNFDGATIVDRSSEIVSPGFISTHGHFAASPFERGVREDWGNPILYGTGLYEHAVVLGRSVDSQLAKIAALSSIAELVRSGVTTAVDVTDWPEETVSAAKEVGLRAYVGPYFRSSTWETNGRTVTYKKLDEGKAAQLFDHAVTFVREHQQSGSLIRGFLAPAQLDTCEPKLLRRAHQIAIDEGFKVQIHAAQSIVEFREMLSRSGRTPIEFMSDLGILDESLIISHCIFVGGHSKLAYPKNADVALVAASGASIAHCPWVFARYGQKLESLSSYLSAGVKVSLGIDSVPQSMLSEMKMAAVVGKIAERDGLAPTARQVYDAATIGGADALGRTDIGRLAPGCRADFCTFETKSPTMSPVRDPIKNIVYSATTGNISSVVVNGTVVFDDGRINGVDEYALAQSLQEGAERTWSDFSRHDHANRSLNEMVPGSLSDWK